MKKLFSRLLRRLARKAAHSPVTFCLTSVPANTPAGATIYLTGSCNGWTTDDPAYAFSYDAATGSYCLALPPGRGILDYKLCRGSWPTIETDADNLAIPNRRYLFGHDPREVELHVLNWEDQGGCIPLRQHSASPNVHIISPAFALPQLRREKSFFMAIGYGFAAYSSAYLGRR
jgi:hypothetical protein